MRYLRLIGAVIVLPLWAPWGLRTQQAVNLEDINGNNTLGADTAPQGTNETDCRTIDCLDEKVSKLIHVSLDLKQKLQEARDRLDVITKERDTTVQQLKEALGDSDVGQPDADLSLNQVTGQESAHLSAGAVRSRLRFIQPDGTSINSGIVLVDNVFLGIYQIESTLVSMRSGVGQFSLRVRPHTLPKSRRLSLGSEYFVRAEVYSPYKGVFVARAKTSQGSPDPQRAVCRIFPQSSDTCATWTVTSKVNFGEGDYPVTLHAQLGSRPAGSVGEPRWDEAIVDLEPPVVIRIPSLGEWLKGKLDPFSTALGIVGTGGVLGIWSTFRSLGKAPKEKEEKNA